MKRDAYLYSLYLFETKEGFAGNFETYLPFTINFLTYFLLVFLALCLIVVSRSTICRFIFGKSEKKSLSPFFL